LAERGRKAPPLEHQATKRVKAGRRAASPAESMPVARPESVAAVRSEWKTAKNPTRPVAEVSNEDETARDFRGQR
jgi:hypothetical protein